MESIEERVKNYYTNIERYDWVTDAKYPEKIYHTLRAKALSSEMRKIITHTDVLEIGCGTGLITKEIQATNIIAVDINEWAMEQARIHANKNNVKVMYGNAEELPFKEDSFDFVVCAEVLEHLVHIKTAINEIYRVLKNEGMLIGTVPSRNPIWKWRTKITRTHPADEPFHNNFAAGEFRRLLSEKFRIVKTQYIALWLGLMFVAKKENEQ